LGTTWKDVVVACFEALFQNFSVRNTVYDGCSSDGDFKMDSQICKQAFSVNWPMRSELIFTTRQNIPYNKTLRKSQKRFMCLRQGILYFYLHQKLKKQLFWTSNYENTFNVV
jgi:hypothetical protein